MRTLGLHLHAAFHESDTRIYRYVQGSIWALILVAIAILVLEALVPEDSPVHEVILAVDPVILWFFIVEICLRVLSYRPPAVAVFKRPPMGTVRTHITSRLAYLFRPLMLVDILAVLAVFPELRGLRALRLLRLLRTTRIFRYRNPFAIVIRSFEENGLLFTLAFSVLASRRYSVESASIWSR